MKKTSITQSRLDGYVTLLSVLIFGAVGMAITLSVILLGTAATQTSLTFQQSNQAKALANACAEDALQTIDTTTGFTGTVNLTLGQGTCTYTVVDLGLSNRTVTASGTVGTVVRKINISLDNINPTIHVTSWQEVAN
jgi:hypothetical protein